MLPKTELIIGHLRWVLRHLRLTPVSTLCKWLGLLELSSILVLASRTALWLLEFASIFIFLGRLALRRRLWLCRCTLGSSLRLASLTSWGRLRLGSRLRFGARRRFRPFLRSRLCWSRLAARFSHRSEILRTTSLFLELFLSHLLWAHPSWLKLLFCFKFIKAIFTSFFHFFSTTLFLMSFLFVFIFFFLIW